MEKSNSKENKEKLTINEKSAGQDKIEALKGMMVDVDSAFNKLTTQQKGFFVDHYTKNISGAKSIANNYGEKKWSKNSCLTYAWRMRKKPAIQAAVAELYRNAGITSERLAEVVNRNLDAKKTFFQTKTGDVIETDIDDANAQLKAVSIGAQLIGDIKPGKDKPGSGININLNIKESNEIEEIVKDHLLTKFGKKRNMVDVDVIE